MRVLIAIFLVLLFAFLGFKLLENRRIVEKAPSVAPSDSQETAIDQKTESAMQDAIDQELEKAVENMENEEIEYVLLAQFE